MGRDKASAAHAGTLPRPSCRAAGFAAFGHNSARAWGRSVHSASKGGGRSSGFTGVEAPAGVWSTGRPRQDRQARCCVITEHRSICSMSSSTQAWPRGCRQSPPGSSPASARPRPPRVCCKRGKQLGSARRREVPRRRVIDRAPSCCRTHLSVFSIVALRTSSNPPLG